jgi:hypothetical protein
MAEKVYKWRIFCTTEDSFQDWWLESDTNGPTACPNNTAHTAHSASLVESVEQQNVRIVEESDPVWHTGGFYRMSSFCYAIPGQSGPHTFQETFNFPVAGLAIQYTGTTANCGDEFRMSAAPNKTIGALTNFAVPGATTFNVSSTVTDNIHIGFNAHLYTGATLQDLNHVVAVDKGAGTITTETGAGATFSPATPTYVQLTVDRGNVHIVHPGQYQIGTSKIGASIIPPQTKLQVVYVNNDGKAKNFVIMLEHLY